MSEDRIFLRPTYQMCVAETDDEGKPLSYALRLDLELPPDDTGKPLGVLGVTGPPIPACICEGLGCLHVGAMAHALIPLLRETHEMGQALVDAIEDAGNAIIAARSEQ